MIVSIVLLMALLAAPVFAESVLDLWNVDSIIDASWLEVETLWTAETGIVNPLGYEVIPLKTGEIFFSSFGGDSGTLRIQAFFAYPASGSNLTGLVINHGMIMDGELSMAQTFAAGLNCFALAISAPGHGASTGGSAYNFENLVRAYPDPRNNHFYQFAYATMRGITYLETLPMISRDWLGVAGFSGGADAGIIASAVDRRIAVSIPIIPQTDFACGAADSGWIVNVFAETGIAPDDSNVIYLENYISPVNYFEHIAGFTMMICAAQDEFEPLDCVAHSFPLLDSSRSRLEIVGNFDHHAYFSALAYTGDYDSFDNTTTFYYKVLGISNSVINLLRLGSPVPQMPSVTATAAPDSIEFVASVPAEYWVSNDVKLWFSVDSAWTFGNIEMRNTLLAPGTFRAKLPNTPANSLSNIIFFVESRCTPIFWLSSTPHVPEGMVFRLRPFPREFFGLNIGESSPLKPEIEHIFVSPNPFNSTVIIAIEGDFECIEIFDIAGRLVERQYKKAAAIDGRQMHVWSPSEGIGSGIYLARAISKNEASAVKRLVFLK